jgi:hypothetical protein
LAGGTGSYQFIRKILGPESEWDAGGALRGLHREALDRRFSTVNYFS